MTVVLVFAVAAAGACPMSGKTKDNEGVSSKGCPASLQAAHGCTPGNAKLAEVIDVETARLPSGALVVMYRGKNDNAVAYLQAASEGPAESFCCPLTRSLAENADCSVEITKITDGALVVVTSEKTEVVDECASKFMSLAAASAE